MRKDDGTNDIFDGYTGGSQSEQRGIHDEYNARNGMNQCSSDNTQNKNKSYTESDFYKDPNVPYEHKMAMANKKMNLYSLIVFAIILLILIYMFHSCETGSSTKDSSSSYSYSADRESSREQKAENSRIEDSGLYEEVTPKSEDSKDYSDADVSKSFADSYLLSDGKYLVGVDLPAGDYIIYGNNFLFDGILTGSYKIYSSSAADAKKICSKTVGNWSFISLEDGQYIDLNRCYLYDISKTDLVNTKTDGEFRVGIDIPAGEYRLRETSSLNCYSVDSGYTAYDKTVGFHMVDGQDYVTVEDGQLLDLAGCVIDEKVG